MSKAFLEALSGNSANLDENLFFKHLLDSISDPKAPVTAREVDLKLIKKKSTWYIQANDDLMYVLSGGLWELKELLE